MLGKELPVRQRSSRRRYRRRRFCWFSPAEPAAAHELKHCFSCRLGRWF